MNQIRLNFSGSKSDNSNGCNNDDVNLNDNANADANANATNGNINNKNNDSDGFSGELKTKNATLKVGMSEGEFLPYEMLMGALGSCLYSTFLDIVKKMRLEFCSCSLDIEWEKRTETPTTCKLIVIKAKINGMDFEKRLRFHKAFQLATEYCSIYCTLSHVAEMRWELDFE